MLLLIIVSVLVKPSFAQEKRYCSGYINGECALKTRLHVNEAQPIVNEQKNMNAIFIKQRTPSSEFKNVKK